MAMRRLLHSILIILVFASPVHAADKWTKQDIIMESVFVAVNAADYYTTNTMINDDRMTNRFTEANPFMGEKPATKELIAWFAATSLIHMTVTNYLPQKHRAQWQLMPIIIKFGAVANNLHLQLGVQF